MLEKIKKYRLSNNFSQQKIADLIGVPRSRYQKWEDGISNPKYEDTILIEKFILKIKNESVKETIDLNTQSNNSPRNLIPLHSDVYTVGNANALNNSTTNGEVAEYIDAGDWFPGATDAIKQLQLQQKQQ